MKKVKRYCLFYILHFCSCTVHCASPSCWDFCGGFFRDWERWCERSLPLSLSLSLSPPKIAEKGGRRTMRWKQKALTTHWKAWIVCCGDFSFFLATFFVCGKWECVVALAFWLYFQVVLLFAFFQKEGYDVLLSIAMEHLAKSFWIVNCKLLKDMHMHVWRRLVTRIVHNKMCTFWAPLLRNLRDTDTDKVLLQWLSFWVKYSTMCAIYQKRGGTPLCKIKVLNAVKTAESPLYCIVVSTFICIYVLGVALINVLSVAKLRTNWNNNSSKK